MAHESVLVVGEDVDELLEQFSIHQDWPDYSVDIDSEVFDRVADFALVARHGKCEYWEVGGTWAGFLILKDGERASQANAGDVDWARMKLGSQEQGTSGLGGDLPDALVINDLWLDLIDDSDKFATMERQTVFWQAVQALPASTKVSILDCKT